MKIFLCFIGFLSIGGSQYGLGHVDSYEVNVDRHLFRPSYQNRHNYHNRHHHKDLSDHHILSRHDHHIERPCPKLDEDCIRHFLAQNSKCAPTYGPVPDRYVIGTAYMDVPHANLSITTFNAQHIGFNTGKIKEFYINKKTDTLVLEVEFGRLIVASPKTVMTFYRKGKEPYETSDYSIVEFNHISLTLTVKHIRDINPEHGHVYTHLSDPNPPIKMGPGLQDHHGDMKWLKEMGWTAREAMVSQGPIYMAVFLQSKLCNFRHH